MTARPRILVLRGGAIGDFILTLPALKALRDPWPDAYVELIGYPHIADLGRIGGTVDRVDSLDRAHIARLFSDRAAPDAELRDRVRSFDLVLTYLHDPHETVRDNLAATGVAQVLYASPVDPPEHASDHLARPLESLAIYAAGRHPVIDPEEGARDEAAQRLRAAGCDPDRTVCLHPGSGSPAKNWPLDRFLDLADRLSAAGFDILFTLGEADAAVAAALDRASPRVGVRWEPQSLCDLAAVLSSVRGYVGNDSGITHLAAAVGLATVALFGPTDPAIWGPRGRRVSLLKAADGRMESLTPGMVLQALLPSPE